MKPFQVQLFYVAIENNNMPKLVCTELMDTEQALQMLTDFGQTRLGAEVELQELLADDSEDEAIDRTLAMGEYRYMLTRVTKNRPTAA